MRKKYHVVLESKIGQEKQIEKEMVFPDDVPTHGLYVNIVSYIIEPKYHFTSLAMPHGEQLNRELKVYIFKDRIEALGKTILRYVEQ